MLMSVKIQRYRAINIVIIIDQAVIQFGTFKAAQMAAEIASEPGSNRYR